MDSRPYLLVAAKGRYAQDRHPIGPEAEGGQLLQGDNAGEYLELQALLGPLDGQFEGGSRGHPLAQKFHALAFGLGQRLAVDGQNAVTPAQPGLLGGSVGAYFHHQETFQPRHHLELHPQLGAAAAASGQPPLNLGVVFGGEVAGVPVAVLGHQGLKDWIGFVAGAAYLLGTDLLELPLVLLFEFLQPDLGKPTVVIAQQTAYLVEQILRRAGQRKPRPQHPYNPPKPPAVHDLFLRQILRNGLLGLHLDPSR